MFTHSFLPHKHFGHIQKICSNIVDTHEDVTRRHEAHPHITEISAELEGARILRLTRSIFAAVETYLAFRSQEVASNPGRYYWGGLYVF